MGAGYTAIDKKYEYYLQPQGEGFVIYDIKNPPEYRGMLQKQAEANKVPSRQAQNSNSDQNYPNYSTKSSNKQNSGFDKYRNYNEADITPEEWRETREQFLKLAMKFILTVSLIILIVLFLIFKQAGSEQALKQIVYLIVICIVALIVLFVSNSKLFKKIEKFIHSYWDEPEDYEKWLKEKLRNEDLK